MDKYTVDALKAMLCRELDESVMRGIKTYQDLDNVKDTTEALKNLYKIEKLSMEEPMYSQRGGQSGENYAIGNSYMQYARAGGQGGGQGGGSSRMYDPYMMERRYSGTDGKEQVIQELHRLMETTGDERLKSTLMECVGKMEKM